MKVSFVHREEIANNISTFWFKPQRKITYQAGQFIEMYLPHKNPDARGIKRWFTLSSSPTENLIAITTKLSKSQMSTYKQKLFALQTGDSIDISEPMGDFVLPKNIKIPIIFVVGGIGITPFRSIIKYLTDKKEQRNLKLIYSAKKSKDFAFLELVTNYGIKPKLIISTKEPDFEGVIGQINPNTILDIDSNDESLIYVSGPEPMVEDLESKLIKSGIDSSRLVLDFFPNYLYV